MKCSIIEMLDKSVINSETGDIIGRICDVELDMQSACLSAIIIAVKGKNGFFALKSERVRVEWCNIKVIGKDAILVDCVCELKHMQNDKNIFEKIWE